MGQARRFSLEKQKGNPGAASVPLGPSGHPKLSDGRVAAGDGARLAAVGANSATVAVSSPALSAPVRRAASPTRRQTSEIQVVLKRWRNRRGVIIIRRGRDAGPRGARGFFRVNRLSESSPEIYRARNAVYFSRGSNFPIRLFDELLIED